MMTKCDRCGNEVGNLFCSFCREEVKGERSIIHEETLVPILFYDIEQKMYVAGCCAHECPCNVKGKCGSLMSWDTFLFIAHPYDGVNCIKQNCG
jgi:hypothetical protein